MNEFRVNEEVYVYDMLAKLHKGIIQRIYTNKYGKKVYVIYILDCNFIVKVDVDRIKRI